MTQVKNVREDKLGPDHSDTLLAMAGLALTYDIQGRRDEAESLLFPAVQRMQHVMGNQHPATVSYMQCLEDILKVKQQGPEQVCSFVNVISNILFGIDLQFA